MLRYSPVQTVDDARYREIAAEKMVGLRKEQRAFSLVDWVLRLIILDRGDSIKELLTVDPTDFHDVCPRKNVRIVDLNRATT